MYVVTVDELDYPLLFIYQDKSGSKTTAISTSELPQALEVLESLVKERWGQDEFSVGMIKESWGQDEFSVGMIKESWGQDEFSVGMVFSESSSDSSSSCYQDSG